MGDVYFSGQGIVYLAERTTGSAVYKAFYDVGNCPSLKLSLATDVVEHQESRSGSRLTDFRLSRQNTARVSMTLEKITKKNLALLLYGSNVTKTGTAVTNETLITSGAAAGDIYFTDYTGTSTTPISALTVVDSTTPSPTTWTLTTHYTVDLTTGRITIVLVPSTPTYPIKVNYTYPAQEIVTSFTSGVKERALIFEGLNTADTNKPVRIEIPRIIFDPVQSFDVINNELAQFELEGSALYDSTFAADSNFGGFARIIGDALL